VGCHDSHFLAWCSPPTRSISLIDRLVGSVIRGVGDIMLLAGEATETIASSTTGVAEEVVRIVEDFAGTLSSAMSPNESEQKRVKAKVKLDSIRQKEDDIGADTSYVTFGSYAAPTVASDEEEPAAPTSEKWSKLRFNEESLIDAIEFITQEFWKLVALTMAETQGVPSFAGELLGVIILCYLAAVWIVSSSPAPHRRDVRDRQDQIIHITHATGDEASELSDLHESSHSDIRTTATRGPQVNKIQGAQRKASCFSWLIAILFLPFRTFLFLLSMPDALSSTGCHCFLFYMALHGCTFAAHLSCARRLSSGEYPICS
jgi:hypothetical protein